MAHFVHLFGDIFIFLCKHIGRELYCPNSNFIIWCCLAINANVKVTTLLIFTFGCEIFELEEIYFDCSITSVYVAVFHVIYYYVRRMPCVTENGYNKIYAGMVFDLRTKYWVIINTFNEKCLCSVCAFWIIWIKSDGRGLLIRIGNNNIYNYTRSLHASRVSLAYAYSVMCCIYKLIPYGNISNRSRSNTPRFISEKWISHNRDKLEPFELEFLTWTSN